MSDKWYQDVKADTPLTQGDLISNCPVLTWGLSSLEFSGADETETLRGAVTAVRADVVVMTQACDLENDKVSNLILCPHLGLAEYRRAWERQMDEEKQSGSAKNWASFCDRLRNGFIWNLALLNSGSSGDLTTDHRIVDFHEVYTVPRSFLESLLKYRGQARLRLLSPYREHLSQAFARYFMRVGLPVEVTRAW